MQNERKEVIYRNGRILMDKRYKACWELVKGKLKMTPAFYELWCQYLGPIPIPGVFE